MDAKSLSKGMKSSGLKRLRWYCQMCEKQCSDENSFKSHCRSEKHIRNMAAFRDNAEEYMDHFSDEFQASYIEILRRRSINAYIDANSVYQELIANKSHIHMNATKWDTLSSFVQYLGKHHIAEVERDEKAEKWLIKYIDKTKRYHSDSSKQQHERHIIDNSTREQYIEKQLNAMKQKQQEHPDGSDTSQATELNKSAQQQIKLSLSSVPSTSTSSNISTDKLSLSSSSHKRPASDVFTISSNGKRHHTDSSNVDASTVSKNKKSSLSTLNALMNENESQKQKHHHQASSATHHADTHQSNVKSEASLPWIHTGLIVKVMNQSLEERKYYKQKGEIIDVDEYTATIEMNATCDNDIIQVDERELETVIPSIGKNVMIVHGIYSGRRGELLDVNYDKYVCSVRIVDDAEDSRNRGLRVDSLEFEDICKVKT
jgi:DNA/RNA-binding protein KIN17